MYSLFADQDEWKLAEWLITNVNQQATEEFLKLLIMHTQTQPSYHSKYMFLKLIDQLPTRPEWTCELMQAHGEVD
ncbi:hypothetical protein J3R82DRAFT_10295 [Butyriboletus roseoflavus]|nr:hypothetical protein J3R82DRAFT_10295 [Butyriboletus roseoflavus]